MGERIAVAMSGGVDSSVAHGCSSGRGMRLMGGDPEAVRPGDAGRDMRRQ